jgi:hypothetical protein
MKRAMTMAAMAAAVATSGARAADDPAYGSIAELQGRMSSGLATAESLTKA